MLKFFSGFASFCIFCLMMSFGVVAQPAPGNFKTYKQAISGSPLECTMVPVTGGKFVMGSTEKSKGHQADESPAKEVTISSFWMGATEVTYDEYDAFFKDETISRNETSDAITRPSPPYIDLTLGMGKQGGFPANSMSQYGAIMYCRWLYNKTGIFYRLPTEAEWEYACRAGTKSAYFFGEDTTGLSKYAWYAGNSDNKYHKTGLKQPNAWGLYDMLGNVAEWTLDQYNEAYFKAIAANTKDPLIKPTTRHPRTLKGGNYEDVATALRSAARLKSKLEWNNRDPQIPRSRWWNADAPFIGFRIVRPLQQPTKEEIDTFFANYIDNF